MKKYIHYISIAAIGFSLCAGGCKKDFLDLDPQASANGNNFYKSEAEIKQAVNGAYSSLRDMGLVSLWLFGEMRSDNTTYQRNTSDRGNEQREFVDQFLVGATAEQIQTLWLQSYTGISRCNDVLGKVNAISMSAESKKQYIGEVSFLRAYHYFNLVRQFGRVPLRINSVNSPEEAKSNGRASVDEVYNAIQADLALATTSLPAKYAAAEAGRATEGAARTLLADVLMTRKRFAEAATELRKVLTLGYSLNASYADAFLPQNKNGAESVFEIQYLGSQPALASNFLYQFAPFTSGFVVTNDSGSPLGGASGWNIPTQDMIAAYETGDARKAASLAEGFTDAAGVFQPIPYVKKYNHGFVDRGRTNDNFPVYRYADVLLMLAECINEQGFGAEAFNYLNQIRTRAQLPEKSVGNINPALAVNTQEEFRTAILQERRVELAFENHRWYDLVRTGKAIDVMNAHGTRQKQQYSYIPAAAYAVTQNRLLLPLPQREVNLDGLDQNPQ